MLPPTVKSKTTEPEPQPTYAGAIISDIIIRSTEWEVLPVSSSLPLCQSDHYVLVYFKNN